MLEVEVINDPAVAMVALDPVRSRLLAELAEPASAAALSTRLGIARQKVNYHLRALESHGLAKVAERRQWGGLTERLLVATAASYVVSPSALGPVATESVRDALPGKSRKTVSRKNLETDRLSASYLISLASRIVCEVGNLLRRSREVNKHLATLSLDAEIRFRSAEDRAAFSNDLTKAITTLVARYHDESAPKGRAHRLVVVAHPLPHEPRTKESFMSSMTTP
ncbi:MAG: winged helix-turn-helix domain-containing protein [Blastocatellales bacterium]